MITLTNVDSIAIQVLSDVQVMVSLHPRELIF
jgi:hypothetical protein